MVQYEFIIRGRVQGVGFRFFVLKRAKEFGIKGWVKNSADGSVMVMAAGTFENIATFGEHLQIGPQLARVTGFVKNRMPEPENFIDFHVVY